MTVAVDEVTAHPLRPVRWSDLAELAALEQELFPDDAWSLESWWGELAGRPRREYVLVEDTGGVVGYAGLDHGGEVSDVMTIAVHPRGRGRGLGRRLLTHLLERATAAGAERVMLEVRADNAAAIALYEAFAFATVSVRRGYYQGVDALVLARDLGGAA